MPSIIANIALKDTFGLRRFEKKIQLPEYPKVGERIWLRIGRSLNMMRVAKRHLMEEGAEGIGFDFARPRFPFTGHTRSAHWLVKDLKEDPTWREYEIRDGDKFFKKSVVAVTA